MNAPLYEGSVSARLRYEPGSPMFTPLKNGGGEIILRVSGEAIDLRAEGGPAAWLARLLGVNITLDPGKVEARTESITAVGDVQRPYIVLRSPRRRRTMELALRPRDDDLGRLVQALDLASVRNCS